MGKGGHVEVGGSTCRIHKGKPMIGVTTINSDTRAKFTPLRRQYSSFRRITVIRGLGEAAFVDFYEERSSVGPQHTVFVFQRGQRLLVTSFASTFTAAQSRRVAAIVAPRI